MWKVIHWHFEWKESILIKEHEIDDDDDDENDVDEMMMMTTVTHNVK